MTQQPDRPGGGERRGATPAGASRDAAPPGRRARGAPAAARLIAAGLGHSMDLRRWRVLLTVRARVGGRRVRDAFVPILTAAVTAGVAFFVSGQLLGHDVPVFAPIAAWLALGHSQDRQLRRVAELGAGVTVGVLLGELFVHLFGVGPVQIAVVLLIAALTAKFLDRGVLLTTQAGVQSVFIVAMPASLSTDGAMGRWSDALVGAALALLVTAVLPVDVVRRPRRLARTALAEIASLLTTLARGLREGDAQLAADALAQGRGSQPILDSWASATRSARDLVRVNPGLRSERGTVAELTRACTLADRAMRNARVVSRRAVFAIEEEGPAPDVAAHVDTLATAMSSLAGAVGRGDPPDHARQTLVGVASELRPDRYEGWRLQTLVSLLRSLAVDALQISGMSQAQALDQLAED
ncbi:aromatic acid exporter family protein [Georgenia sp. AZ-5]|uniref:FUSC family protein n=1 Tax=Georgenia sp. AZ-5 TaxID=3367526 RepID=UPI00375478CF